MGILAKNWPLPVPMPAGLVGWFLAVAVSILVSICDADPFAGRLKPEQAVQPTPVTKPVPSEGLAARYPGDEGLERDPEPALLATISDGPSADRVLGFVVGMLTRHAKPLGVSGVGIPLTGSASSR